MATLRTAAPNLLRLAGVQSIRTGMQVMHDIAALLAKVMRRPNPCEDFGSALPESLNLLLLIEDQRSDAG